MDTRYTLRISKEANKYIQSLTPKLKDRINTAFWELSQNPKSATHVKPLQGETKDRYRYRLGGLRIIYSISGDNLYVDILKVGPRGDVYK
jgi:mRNA interferase RelE/StbE